MDEHQGGRNRKGPFLSVVSVDDIPKANPTPCDNLVDVYRFCLELRSLCEKLHGTGLSRLVCHGICLLSVVFQNRYKSLENPVDILWVAVMKLVEVILEWLSSPSRRVFHSATTVTNLERSALVDPPSSTFKDTGSSTRTDSS